MIPPFYNSGYLPPGVYPATLDEIEARFGRDSESRRAQMESVRWMVDLAVLAGVQRIVLNGSFVTDIIEPNDVDCVLLVGHEFPQDAHAAGELAEGLPYLQIDVVDQVGFDRLVKSYFATDRQGAAKGMVEIEI